MIKLALVDLKAWRKKHPRSSKKYPAFYADCIIDGTKEDCPAPYTWQSIVRLIIERDNRQCRICGRNGHHRKVKMSWYGHEEYWWKYNLDVHHIIKREDGGSDHPKNLVSVCNGCHKQIHASTKIFKERISEIKKQLTLQEFCR